MPTYSRRRLPLRFTALAAAAWLATMATFACAADANSAPAPAGAAAAAQTQVAGVDAIDRKIREIQVRRDLDAATRDQILEILRSARSDLDRVQALQAQAASYKAAVSTGAAELDQLGRSIAGVKSQLDGPVDVIAEAALSSDELTQVAARSQTEEAELRGKLASLEDELARRADRAGSERRELVDARAATQDIAKQLDEVNAQPASAMRDARIMAISSTLAAKQTEAEALEQEIAAQPTLYALAQRQRDEAQLRVAQSERRAKALDELVNKRRIADAETAKAELDQKVKELGGKHPILQRIAENNSQLGTQLAQLAVDIERVRTQRDAFRDRADRIEAQVASLKARVHQGSLSEGLARILYEEGQRLPQRADFAASRAERDRTVTQLTADMFQLEQREGVFEEVAPNFEAFKAKLEERIPKEEAERIAEEGWSLVQQARSLVAKIKIEQQRLLRLLVETDGAEIRMLDDADAARALLDRILFWVPVTKPGAAWFGDLMHSVAALLSPAGWATIFATLWEESKRYWPIAIAALVLVAVLLYFRRAFISDMKRIAAAVATGGPRQMTLTLRALAVSVLIALPWPLLAAAAGAALTASSTRFADQVGTGLAVIAVPLMLNLLLLTLCAPYGVGPAHLGWRDDATDALRKAVRWLLAVVVPAAFVSAAMGPYATSAERATLGRIAFICVVGAYAWALIELLRFDRPPMRGLIKERPDAWIVRFRYVWFATLLLLLTGIVVIAAGGYLYAARSIVQRLAQSMWLVVGAVILMHLIARWIIVERARRAQTPSEDTSGEVIVEGAVKRIERADTGRMDLHARQFVGSLTGLAVVVGLFLIWRDAIPALSVIGEVVLWQQTVTINGANVLRPVTLGDAVLAIVIGFVMVAAVKNVSGVLEMILPARLRRDSGVKFAIGATARYLIIGVGIVSMLSLLGVAWSKLQWLVAAMGVGLGFGLQEIVANFVSGLIILYERPIRIGDTITVGNVTGVVSDIHIRATTITDADQRDVLIPNKSFITQQVINWTLSDPTTRLLLTVGVAYGTDPEVARRVILEAVKSSPTILREPAPSVVFSAFSASSLDFEVRAFAREMGDRLPLRHEINTAIAKAVKEAGIEFPLSQQDVYIRSVPEELVRATRDAAGKGEPGEPKPQATDGAKAQVPSAAPLNVVRRPES